MCVYTVCHTHYREEASLEDLASTAVTLHSHSNGSILNADVMLASLKIPELGGDGVCSLMQHSECHSAAILILIEYRKWQQCTHARVPS